MLPGLEQPAPLEEVVAEGVRTDVERGDAQRRLALEALGQDHEPVEHVDIVEPGPGPVGEDLTPPAGTGVAVGRRQEPEVDRVLVGELHPPTLVAVAPVMVGGVLDALPTGARQAGSSPGLPAGWSTPRS